MKKLFIFLTLLFMVVLAGCNNGDASSEGEGGDSADAGASYPEQEINVVVPAGAGGDTDRNTRVTAEYLSEELGQELIVNNITGSGGTVGVDEVNNAEADGYTVLAFHNSMIINDILGLTDVNYENFELVGSIVQDNGNAFIVNADSDIQDIETLIEMAQESPGEIQVATETGAFTHLQLLEFQEETGTEFNVVDVGGAADKTTALLGDQIDIIPTQQGLVQEYIDSGDFRSLGVMSEERLEGAPDTPTFTEQGADIVYDKFFFWAFPEGTPQEVVDKFTGALESVANNEEFQNEMSEFLVDVSYMNPEETQQLFEDRTEKYSEIYEQTQQ
ncbi:tripartite tricarboxylate transporter substrate binding protein [Salinicoccus sp. ID82-1]|uniref:tripartite tricarboxylate transporter substrate binding protein n=1 Tax=Salinicoccus sp. ID82-1 TaxID=2820269 RepID=UPI001F1AD671|nr:tripartite tricarboxylate transporter substrate binding protein [Salinicoccus sp. ID82-1]MCG1009743.1 tripartite tricarboxylate transporter substrate binding protein [Salinicoccus sp. ID82-1]